MVCVLDTWISVKITFDNINFYHLYNRALSDMHAYALSRQATQQVEG